MAQLFGSNESIGKDSDSFLEGVTGEMSTATTGVIKSPETGQPSFNTLDEPIRETIVRDLKAVGNKFWHVLYPHSQKSLLTEWDLWGPLILCTFMALLLQGDYSTGGGEHDGGPEFAQVFVIVWVGSVLVTVNTKLLGGSISFFQSVCVLGYCLLPLAISLLACRIILVLHQNILLFIVRCTVTLVGFVWAIFAAVKFLGDCSPPRRKVLAVYPMALFYFVIGWLVVSSSNS